MQLRYPIQIQSMLKALTDVVLPAVDPDNKLAQEQARIVIGMLTLMAKQLPLQFRLDRESLVRLVALADQLWAQTTDAGTTEAAMERLAAQARAAAQVLDRAGAEPDELVSSIHGLRTAISGVITAVSRQGSAGAVGRMERAVLDSSAQQLLRDRSWLLMQGWEPDPASLPPIEALIGSAGSGADVAS